MGTTGKRWNVNSNYLAGPAVGGCDFDARDIGASAVALGENEKKRRGKDRQSLLANGEAEGCEA